MADTQIGEITHYYNHLGVAVVELTGTLKVGDTIKIIGHGNEFTQAVTSMQIEHEQLDEAHKDQEIGMKMDKEVKEGDKVYKITV